jgi:hypothetical protein
MNRIQPLVYTAALCIFGAATVFGGIPPYTVGGIPYPEADIQPVNPDESTLGFDFMPECPNHGGTYPCTDVQNGPDTCPSAFISFSPTNAVGNVSYGSAMYFYCDADCKKVGPKTAYTNISQAEYVNRYQAATWAVCSQQLVGGGGR